MQFHRIISCTSGYFFPFHLDTGKSVVSLDYGSVFLCCRPFAHYESPISVPKIEFISLICENEFFDPFSAESSASGDISDDLSRPLLLAFRHFTSTAVLFKYIIVRSWKWRNARSREESESIIELERAVSHIVDFFTTTETTLILATTMRPCELLFEKIDGRRRSQHIIADSFKEWLFSIDFLMLVCWLHRKSS